MKSECRIRTYRRLQSYSDFGFLADFGSRVSEFNLLPWKEIQFRSRPDTLIAFKNHPPALHCNRRLACQGDRLQSFPAIESRAGEAMPIKMVRVVRVTPGANIHLKRLL